MPSLITRRKRLPQFPTSFGTAVTNHAGHDLTGGTTQSDPHPTFVDALEHKRPKFIQFQHRGGGVVRVWFKQRLAQGRERGVFFFNQPLTVLRATPKVRVKPRIELRSS